MRYLIFVMTALALLGCTAPRLVKRTSETYKVQLPKNAGVLELPLSKTKFPYALNKPVKLWTRDRVRPKRIYKEVDKYYQPIMIVPYGSNYLFLLKDGVTLMSLEFFKGKAELTLLGSASDQDIFNLEQWHGRALKRQLTPEFINSLTFQFESFVGAAEVSL